MAQHAVLHPIQHPLHAWLHHMQTPCAAAPATPQPLPALLLADVSSPGSPECNASPLHYVPSTPLSLAAANGWWRKVVRLRLGPPPSSPRLLPQPGDCVILNAANSTVGQLVVQLCCLLRLRVVAVISKEPDFEKTSLWLKALGAVEVLLDQGSFRVGGLSSACCGFLVYLRSAAVITQPVAQGAECYGGSAARASMCVCGVSGA